MTEQPSPVEALVREIRSKQKVQTMLIAALAAFLVVAICIIGFLSFSLYTRDKRRSVTIDALEAFAKNNNCVNDRGETFQKDIIDYLTSPDPAVRAQALDAYKALKPCPKVVLPGIATTTTTKEKP